MACQIVGLALEWSGASRLEKLWGLPKWFSPKKVTKQSPFLSWFINYTILVFCLCELCQLREFFTPWLDQENCPQIFEGKQSVPGKEHLLLPFKHWDWKRVLLTIGWQSFLPMWSCYEVLQIPNFCKQHLIIPSYLASLTSVELCQFTLPQAPPAMLASCERVLLPLHLWGEAPKRLMKWKVGWFQTFWWMPWKFNKQVRTWKVGPFQKEKIVLIIHFSGVKLLNFRRSEKGLQQQLSDDNREIFIIPKLLGRPSLIFWAYPCYPNYLVGPGP